MTTHKAVALSRELADRLAKRFAPLEVAESFDSSGNPVITISDGSPATGERVIVVRTVGDPTDTAKDILGNTANHYTPHKVQIVTEADDGAGSGNIGAFVTFQDLMNVFGEAAPMGMAIEWYESATTDVPAVAEIVPANLKATYRSLYWNKLSQS